MILSHHRQSNDHHQVIGSTDSHLDPAFSAVHPSQPPNYSNSSSDHQDDEILTTEHDSSTPSSNQLVDTNANQVIQSSIPSNDSDLEACQPADQLVASSQRDPFSFPGRPPGLHPLAIPPLSLSQKLYIVLPQMIGAAILDGLANFGIGCAMYLNAKNVRIWILKNNTVAGDMALTIFIQGVLTFCIASGMVHVDLRKNKISAFRYPWPDTSWGAAKRLPPDHAKTRVGRLWRRFHNSHGFSRGLHFFSGSDVNDIFDSRLTRSQFFTRLFWSIWKGSVLSVFYFFLIWPISIAIVSPIWAGQNLGNRNFTAPLIKAVYGFIFGLLMNPVCAMIAMGSEDSVRHHREEIQRERFKNPEKAAMKTTAAERVSMVSEPVLQRPILAASSVQPISALERAPSQAHSHVAQPHHTPQRVESLRRSLDTLGTRNNGGATNVVEFEDQLLSSSRGHGSSGLGWRSADVHRRRSLDTARRSSRGRYGASAASADLTRSTSVGSSRIRPKNDTYGLFGPSGQLGSDSNDPTNQRSRFHHPQKAVGRMRTLSEHSVHPSS